MDKKIQGYLTVEAALLFPLILGIMLFIIYFWFYQYDRCLMEQDTGALALRGCALGIQEKDELMKKLLEQENEIYQDKYVAWQQEDVEIKLEKDTIQVKCQGQLRFLFGGLNFWSSDNIWKTKAQYENHRTSPVLFIRSWRKVKGGE